MGVVATPFRIAEHVAAVGRHIERAALLGKTRHDDTGTLLQAWAGRRESAAIVRSLSAAAEGFRALGNSTAADRATALADAWRGMRQLDDARLVWGKQTTRTSIEPMAARVRAYIHNPTNPQPTSMVTAGRPAFYDSAVNRPREMMRDLISASQNALKQIESEAAELALGASGLAEARMLTTTAHNLDTFSEFVGRLPAGRQQAELTMLLQEPLAAARSSARALSTGVRNTVAPAPTNVAMGFLDDADVQKLQASLDDLYTKDSAIRDALRGAPETTRGAVSRLTGGTSSATDDMKRAADAADVIVDAQKEMRAALEVLTEQLRDHRFGGASIDVVSADRLTTASTAAVQARAAFDEAAAGIESMYRTIAQP